LAQAEVYSWKDKQGRTHFSDTPVNGSKKHTMQALSSIENPAFNLQRNTTQLPYQDHNGSMIVEGMVNQVRMQFVVDTGASLVVIPPAIAKKANINTQNSQSITLQTANGATQAPLIHISNLKIGQLQQTGVRSVVQTISNNPNLGLLGMSFLGAYKMSINHQQHIITLETP